MKIVDYQFDEYYDNFGVPITRLKMLCGNKNGEPKAANILIETPYCFLTPEITQMYLKLAKEKLDEIE